MTEVTEPGWRPEYRGGDLGDVGSGQRFGVKLYYLYRAGRNEFPAAAATYARAVAAVHDAWAPMEAAFERPQRGPERAQRRVLELRDEVHDVLRQTCLRMQEVGAALVEIADRYAATDEAAAAEFARLLDEHADEYRTPAPQPQAPPAVGERATPPWHVGGDRPSPF